MKKSALRRILILLFSGFIIIFLINSIYIINLRKILNKNFEDARDRSKELLSNIINIKNISLQKFVDDYTSWDDMVKYIKQPDSTFAKDNFEVSAGVFNADYCWVYNLNNEKIYYYQSKKADSLDLRSVRVKLASLFQKNHLIHFYVYLNKRVIEIFGGTVHPSFDEERKTPANGYFFVGKIWDDKYISEVKEATGINIRIETDTTALEHRLKNSISFVLALKSEITLKPETYIIADRELPNLVRIKRSYNSQVTVIIILCLIFLFIVIFLSIRWFVSPVRLLMNALINEIDMTEDKRISGISEYKQFAELIATVLSQKKIMAHSSQLYYKLLSLFPDAIVITGPDFRIQLCNEKAE